MFESLLHLLGLDASQTSVAQAQVVSAAVAFISACLAMLAAAIAVWQINVGRSIQRESIARQIYADYLKVSLDHPELASAQWQRLSASLGADMAAEKYDWFVSVMLNASESILLFVAGNSAWVDVVEAQLSYHAEYLRSERFAPCLKQYDGKMRKLLDSLIES